MNKGLLALFGLSLIGLILLKFTSIGPEDEATSIRLFWGLIATATVGAYPIVYTLDDMLGSLVYKMQTDAVKEAMKDKEQDVLGSIWIAGVVGTTGYFIYKLIYAGP